ncbi:MAG TPA: histidine kinase dimerization/phosphoacceptor domain -containing protein, partial [Chitinophagaceae bacterium]|nr:histidine kinase dimerization/phosphoacceptor domain -containing protein [Chitinophagaceae bacterium]
EKRKPIDINDRRLIQKVLGDCYNALKKYDLAEQCYVEMIRLGNEQKSNYSAFDKAIANSTIGNFYLKRGNYDKALIFLEIALKSFEENGTLQYMKETHLSLFKVDSALGDYLGAIKNLQQNNLLGDSIFSIARNKQIEELQIKYQTDQKDNDFRLLQGKEKLAQVKLQHTKSTRNWIIAGASMLLIIAGLLYRQTVVRKKNNTIITRKNGQLEHLLTEKEWLLKEIHHRVKNNLQIVMSLLNSQSAYIDNESALTAIHDSQHRVHAMSLIHQKLYNSENVSSIDMSFYIRELVSYLSDSFSTGQRIRFEFAIEPLEMDVSQAVPLGLILNEAITNSLKYAFPNGRTGVISILLLNTAMHHYLLSISDNGIGMPAQFNNKKPGSLGMSLMAGLSEDLDGNFSIENDNGTTIKVSFVHDVGVKKPGLSATSFVSNN